MEVQWANLKASELRDLAALRVVVDELRRLDMRLLTATYWQVDPVAIAELLERQSGVQHACEAETSMVMALRPELVDASKFAAAKHVEPGRVAGQAQALHSA